MTRTRLTRAESKARTRGELVGAARQVFLERGYHAASVEAVAEAAGYSTGAVYSAFGSKADLFLAVLDARVAERAGQMHRIAAMVTTVAELGERLARQYTALNRTERAWSLLVMEFWPHAARDPDLRRRFAERHEVLKAATARVVEETLARSGERLALATEHVATVSAALANGMALERLTNPDAVPDDLLAMVAGAMLRALTVAKGSA
jgi:AcrR family transcriptional regulator